MFIAIYQAPTPLILPNGTRVENGDCFLAVQGKGLVKIYDNPQLQAIGPVEIQLPLKRIVMSPVQFTVFWQLFTPRADTGVVQPI